MIIGTSDLILKFRFVLVGRRDVAAMAYAQLIGYHRQSNGLQNDVRRTSC